MVSWLAQPLAHIDPAMLGAVALLVAQACVVLFLWTFARAVDVPNRRQFGVLVIAVIAFPPLIDQIVQRNIEVLLLGLSGVWLLGWVAGDRWWAGAVLGLGMALKLVQAPLLALDAWGRRWVTTTVAVVVFVALWAVGSPQYLPEYLLKVIPEVNTGTGYAMDIAPLGAVARFLHPASIYGIDQGVDLTVRAISAVISLTVFIVTLLALWAPRQDRGGRALEAAAVIAATPLLVTVVRPGHMLLLLLPVLVLATLAFRERNVWLGVAVAVSWTLMGPAYLWYTNLFAAGFRGALMTAGEELALLGMLILWRVRALRFPLPIADNLITPPDVRRAESGAADAAGLGR